MSEKIERLSCPIPHNNSSVIKLGHGSGGKMTEKLINEIFLPKIGNDALREGEDAAILDSVTNRIVLSTDSFVVSPLFFPGGDIGSLAVHGTVNDLSMRGAIPKALTAAFILEEGFSIDQLSLILESMEAACKQSDVLLLAADTKVVGRGAADKLFITTSGVGYLQIENPPSVSKAKVGDLVVINGDIGRHGIVIMIARESLNIESSLSTDSAPLNHLVQNMIGSQYSSSIHCLRDVTRGGLASVTNEIASASNVGIVLDEASIPIHPEVKAVCELLGLDPLYVACEGRFISIVDKNSADGLIEVINKNGEGAQAKVIGQVVREHPKQVVIRSLIGGHRIVDRLSGEQLPRIC